MAFPLYKCSLAIASGQKSGSPSGIALAITQAALPSSILDADGDNPAQSGGGDLRAYADEALTTQIPLDVITFTTDNNPSNGTALLVVNFDDLVGDTLWLAWGSDEGTKSQPAANDTYGQYAVYHTSYKGLWPLVEASGNAIDRTSNQNELAESSGVIGSTIGKLTKARDFEQTDTEYFVIADNPSLSTGNIDWTFSAWVQIETKVGSDMTIASKIGTGATASLSEWTLRWQNSPDAFSLAVSTGVTYITVRATNLGSPALDTWYYVVCWHDSVNDVIGISVNGGTPNTVSFTTGIPDTEAPFYLGNVGISFSQYWDGPICHATFAKRTRSSGENTTLYNCENNNGAFWDTGDVMATSNPLGRRNHQQYTLHLLSQ